MPNGANGRGRRYLQPPSMPRPRLTSQRRSTRILLYVGFLWAITCWSWVMFILSSTTSHDANGNGMQFMAQPPAIKQPELRITKTIGQQIQSSLNSTTIRNGNTDFYGDAQSNHNYLRPRLLDQDATTRFTPDSSLHRPPPTTSFSFPLHAKSGTHHAYLYIGSPPQRQTVIVDTGSRLTAFPCYPHCPDCGHHASSPFQLSKSSSHEIVSCDKCQLSEGDFQLQDYFLGDGIGGNSGDGDSSGGGGGPLLRGGGMTKTNTTTNENDNDKHDGLVDTIGKEKDAAWRRNLIPESCVDKQCELVQKYTEGSSWKAFEVKDKVWLGLNGEEDSLVEHVKYATPFVFGCQVSEMGLFRTQYADGIMGLSMYTQTLIGTWHANGSIPNESFSLCFSRKGGRMSIGGLYDSSTSSSFGDNKKSDVGHHLAPMKFTPFARKDVWHYSVTVISMSVGSRMLPKGILQYLNDHRGTIVDSGTTDTFLSHHISKAFSLAWEQSTGKKYHNRLQNLTFEQFNSLPVITFELEGGISWGVRPEAYMEIQDSASPEHGASGGDDLQNQAIPLLTEEQKYEQWKGTQGFVSRIYVDEPTGAVLGANVMMDHDVYFDVGNRRLGVARARCDN